MYVCVCIYIYIYIYMNTSLVRGHLHQILAERALGGFRSAQVRADDDGA